MIECCYGFFISVALIYLFYNIFYLLSRMIVIPYNIIKRYGGGWAVVTGGSDGIGLGFCQQLAKEGFNICIIGRNKQKIENVCKQLLQINKNIKTKIVIADFANSLSDTNFFAKIQGQLESIDISVLVNNVGIMLDPQQFIENEPSKIKQEIVINNVPISMLIRKLLPNMIQRHEKTKKKSLIVNLSSFISDYPARFSANYSSTKLFDDFLSRSVGYENKDKVDFLSVRPALVTTPLTRNTSSMMHVNKNQCAKGALRMAGKRSYTYGHWWHQLQAFISKLFSPEVRNLIVSTSQQKMGALYKKIDESQ